MKRTKLVALVVLLGLLTACGTSPETEEVSELPVDFTPLVSVTGKLAPEVWATVSAQSGGVVRELAIAQGDGVAVGDLLLQLDDAEALLAVAQAEAALAAAHAELVRLQAPPREEEIAVAAAQVAAANAGLAQAGAQRDEWESGGQSAMVAAAEAQVAAAEADAWSAKDVYDRLAWQLGDIATLQWRAAQAALTAAQAGLAQAETGSAARQRAVSAGVWMASAQREVAEAQLGLLQAGVRTEDLAVAEAAVRQAEVALELAQLALERTRATASVAGVVGRVHVRTGEFVTPGQPLMVVGDLTTLRVETTDLDEIDVALVVQGCPATVTFDALPDRTYAGRVTQIAPMAEPGTGGVHYTVIITLAELDPVLRWGMTAFVDIAVEE